MPGSRITPSVQNLLAHTFHTRNLPLSDGNDEKNFEGKYEFDWEKYALESYVPTAVKEAAAAKVTVKPEPVPAIKKKETSEEPPMIYDVETDSMIPFS